MFKPLVQQTSEVTSLWMLIVLKKDCYVHFISISCHIIFHRVIIFSDTFKSSLPARVCNISDKSYYTRSHGVGISGGFVFSWGTHSFSRITLPHEFNMNPVRALCRQPFCTQRLHRSHQDAVEGLDSSVLETSILDVSIHVTTHIVNSGVSVNCNHQYINITLASITILYLHLQLYIFNVVHV